ncbi:MAG: HNH endonuclease [Gemmatimonadaceae bacterium]
MSERTCSKCGQIKPETLEFFRSRGTKDRGGLRPDCRECSAARDKAYYQANQENFRSYRAANAEQISTYQAQYMQRYMQTPAWKDANRRARSRWLNAGGRAMVARAAQRRRARKAGLPSTFTGADWDACLAWFGQVCAYCGIAGDLAQEHVVALSAGGGYVPENIIPACEPCNSSKNAKPMDAWFRGRDSFSEERVMLIYSYLEAVATR